MNGSILFLSLMIPASVILIILSICLLLGAKNKQRRCTQKATGTVIRYSYADNDISLPIVEYFVDGIRYLGKRKWRGYQITQGPWVKESAVIADKDKNTLKIRETSFEHKNPICELYPVGMCLDVFYNPEKPRQNYAEVIDNKPSVAGVVLLFTALGIAALGIAGYFLLLHLL